ncbi:MAG TPA: hypothetical protein VNZ22_07680, partial [Bacillota bacterium]|nr:hypothetical protein [Bacillota bacterium]
CESREMLRALLLLLLIVLVIYGGVWLTTFGVEMLSAVRFGAFTHRIASADHVVVANSSARPQAFKIGGEDAKRLVRAVSCAKRYISRPGLEDASIYGDKATFFAGTNALGCIQACGRLFMVNGKKYQDDTGVVRALVSDGRQIAYSEWVSSMIGEKAK